MVSLRKLSELYGIPLYTLRTWATWRLIPCLKLGKKIYVKIDEFERWLEEKTENWSFYGKWRFRNKELNVTNFTQLDYKDTLIIAIKKYLKENDMPRDDERISQLSADLNRILKVMAGTSKS